MRSLPLSSRSPRQIAMQQCLDHVYAAVKKLPVYGEKRDGMIRAASSYVFDVFDGAMLAEFAEHSGNAYADLARHASLAMVEGFEAFPRARQDIAGEIDRIAAAFHPAQGTEAKGLLILMPSDYLGRQEAR